MEKAFAQLLAQALTFQVPASPEFDLEMRVGHLNRIRAETIRTLHDENHRQDGDQVNIGYTVYRRS